MLLQTFTLLLLSSTALTLDTTTTTRTTEAITAASTGGIKEENFPAVAPEVALIETHPGLLPPSLETGAEDGLRRRLISYDQRQEGQYNIRADLENFMIVLIPPGPQEGLSLLDLLTSPSLRGASKSSSNKRKHPHASALKSFYQRQQQQQHQQQLQLQPQPNVGGSLPEFLEGRTPYHVDISASANEEQQQQPRLHRQQVDVLPPQLIPQLIKPYHLEAEPELIQALPPSSSSSGNSGSGSNFNPLASQYYRNSRALRGESFLETNRLGPDPASSSVGSSARSISVPLYRGQGNTLYPPIDVPAYMVNEAQPRLWQLDDEPTPIQPKHLVETDMLSFELLGDALADSKVLLRDGLARCAPGQRRDSYGACRQVEGY